MKNVTLFLNNSHCTSVHILVCIIKLDEPKIYPFIAKFVSPFLVIIYQTLELSFLRLYPLLTNSIYLILDISFFHFL